MKNLLISILLSTGLFANTATVDCTEMNEVIKVLQGYADTCQVAISTHTFTQELSSDAEGILEYEDGSMLPFVTINKTINLVVGVDRPFTIKTGDFVSDRFKLTLLSDGTESWKYFYIGTSRWRNYTFEVINVTTEPTVTYPIVTHVGVQGIPLHFTNRIIDVNGTAIPNLEVRFIGDNGWKYITKTDANGIFEFDVTDREEFILSALYKGVVATYDHKLSINIYNNFFESNSTLDMPSNFKIVIPSEWNTIQF